jgi:hypothetical protein
MKAHRWPTILRWLCILPAVSASFITAILLSTPYEIFIHAVLLRLGLFSSNANGFQFALEWDGPLAAILFVLSGTIVAPTHRKLVAFALFGLGAVLTPLYLNTWDIKPSYHLYPVTGRLEMFWPIASTYMGGALAIGIVFIATHKSSKARLA